MRNWSQVALIIEERKINKVTYKFSCTYIKRMFDIVIYVPSYVEEVGMKEILLGVIWQVLQLHRRCKVAMI